MGSKGLKRPLLQASTRHAATDITAVSKDLETVVKQGDDAINAIPMLREVAIVARTKTPMTPQTFATEMVRVDGTRRPLIEVLAEGPAPGRLPRPSGAAIPDETPRPGVTRPIDRGASFEPFPGEFQGLRATGLITKHSEEAARRLGFDLNSKGSAMEGVFQYLYAPLYRQNVKAPGHQGQLSNIFSPLTEYALNANRELLRVEDEAVKKALAAMAKNDPNIKVFDYAAMEKSLPMPIGPTDTGAQAFEGFALLRKYRPAKEIIDIELHNVRDTRGKTGWPVTDRLRGLLDLRKTPPEFTIISIGEAKAKSGYNAIIGQVVQDVERLLQGLRAPQGGSGAAQSIAPVQVSFGPRLVVATLSEVAAPDAHIAALIENLKSTFTGGARQVPDVEHKVIDPTSIFEDARTIATELQAALNALAAKPAQ